MTYSGKIRVIHILEGFSGGTATYISTLLPMLAERGFDVTLICSLNRGCLNAEDRITRLTQSGINVHVVPMCRQIRPLADLHSFVRILRILACGEFQVVHTHCSKAGAMGRLAAAIVGHNARFHSAHCFAFLRAPSRVRAVLYLLLERWLGKLTTRLLAVGESESRIAVQYGIVPASRCITVCNGLIDDKPVARTLSAQERETMRESLGIAKAHYVVSTAGRLVGYKGGFRFLKAARLCRTCGVVFLIAGEGELRPSLERYVRDHDLSACVRFLGQVSDMDSLYAASDLFVLCSDAEAQPYVLLEAMRAQCPTIATAVLGNADLIQHRRTGLLVDSTAEAIARSIDELLVDHARRAEYARDAYKRFRQYHLVERQVSQITSAYLANLPEPVSRGHGSRGRGDA